MARVTRSKSKTISGMVKPVSAKKPCTSCGKSKNVNEPNSGFYKSNHKLDADGRTSACKLCIKQQIDYGDLQTVKDVLRTMDRPFLSEVWTLNVEECNRDGISDYFGKYLKNIQLNHKNSGWNDGDNSVGNNLSSPQVEKVSPGEEIIFSDQDEQNKADVLRMIGYDPFESESDIDKKGLYNKLVDFLDEGTLEDSYKLPVVISIVKTFGQIDKIDRAISKLTADINSLTQNTGSIKSLMDAKKGLLTAITALAKDNGLSVNHNNNKSKGGNTLNGIVKKLNEIGLDEASVNVFNLETAEAMKQIADISHRSILDQLMLDENDYAEMISEQKQMIQKLDGKVITLEEENRKLKIALKVYSDGGDASS
ncbi:hypothetical protein [Paenibacillus sp. FSL E2-0178]|uniref:hypothetical protein n=1 Tax=Paenibacillus sp. FSL E2-0178 TaxID=2921361 RepID=UPI0031590360